MMIFFWGILAYLAYLFLSDRSTDQRVQRFPGLSIQERPELKAEEILKQRYAKGEVTDAQYFQILNDLRK